jgi:hypothetical protein
VPALTAELLRALIETHRAARAAGTVLSFEPPDTRSYGRIVRDDDGRLARIVEARDATLAELEVGEVNSGIYVFQAEKLWPALERLQPQNAEGELYVTDTLGLLVDDGDPVAVHVAPDPFEVEGINTRSSSRSSRRTAQPDQRGHILARGHDPRSYVGLDHPTVEIEPDATITVRRPPWPHAVGGNAVFSQTVAVDADVGPGAIVGPLPSSRNGPRGGFRREPSWNQNSRIRPRTGAAPFPSATPTSERRKHRRRHDHREPRASGSRPGGRTRIGRTGTGITMASSPPSRSETVHGSYRIGYQRRPTRAAVAVRARRTRGYAARHRDG